MNLSKARSKRHWDIVRAAGGVGNMRKAMERAAASAGPSSTIKDAVRAEPSEPSEPEEKPEPPRLRCARTGEVYVNQGGHPFNGTIIGVVEKLPSRKWSARTFPEPSASLGEHAKQRDAALACWTHVDGS